MPTDNKTADSVTRQETISINSSSTTNTGTNNSIDTNKLLSKKQQEQPTAKKQTPLEKYLDEYAEKLENKSPEELQKEKEQLERQKKKSLIIPIIFAILALIALITACILLPLMAAIAIAIPFAIGAITMVASGIIDYNIINKKIDRVNVKKSQLSLREKTQLRGNNKACGASIQQKASNNQITMTKNNIANNSSVVEENAKKNTNNINNNILKKDQGNTNNINNNQNLQKENKNNTLSNTNGMPNNVTDNTKNNTNSNNIKNDNSKANNEKAQTEINIKNTSNNNSNHSATQARYIKDDNEAANLIYSQTAERVLKGTLDLSNHPNEQEYNTFKQTFYKKTVNPRIKAHAQQQMIKYEIWNQLSQTSQQNCEQLIKEGKSPEEIKDKVKDKANWQVNLYNKHLENEEQKNQSLLSAINPVNWIVSKNEKSIKEKRDAVKTAILKGSQQANGIQLSGISTTIGANHDSGAIKNKDTKTKVNQIN